jgi:hypothetical protein
MSSVTVLSRENIKELQHQKVKPRSFQIAPSRRSWLLLFGGSPSVSLD